MTMLEIDIYSDILSVAAHFVDERIERLVERSMGDQLKVNYQVDFSLSDTDSPDNRNMRRRLLSAHRTTQKRILIHSVQR